MKNFDELLEAVASRPVWKVAVAVAQDPSVIQAVVEAHRLGIAEATLVGDEKEIHDAAKSVGASLDGMKIVHERSRIRAIGEAKNGARDRAFLIGHVRAHHCVVRNAVLVGEVGDDDRTSLSEQTKKGRGSFSCRGVTQMNNEIGRLHVRRQLVEGHTARDDGSTLDIRPLQQAPKTHGIRNRSDKQQA